MKKSFVILFFTVFSIAVSGQQKKYGTKTISQWTFEKFPLHFEITPSKIKEYRNQITGKLEVYEEQNNVGQTSGLKLTMSEDGINPDDAIYVYKGQMVYAVHFFTGSKTARQITTYNEKGQKDGYRIIRELKGEGGYSESIERYENDVLTELNGVKQAPMEVNFVNNLLNGKFKFETKRRWVIEGEADNGKLKWIKQSQEGGTIFMSEMSFTEKEITVKEPNTNKEGFQIEKYPIVSTPLVTDSKELCLKYGNYNGYPYLYLGKDFEFDIRDIKVIASQIYVKPLETKVNYVDSLLDGDFQFRQYIYNGSFEYEGIVSITGKASKGSIKFLRVRKIMCEPMSGNISSDKATEYTFQDSKILVNEFVPDMPREPVASSALDYLHPVLLTNSIKGGSYSYSYADTNNTLGVPINLSRKLAGNENGYMYFSPTEFSVATFISTATTQVDKPVVQKTNFNKGLLDGNFEFKEDGIYFNGNAKIGVIQDFRLKSDFKNSKDIIAPGTIWNGKSIKYDIMEVKLIGNEYNVSYFNSENNTKTYEETIVFSKNRKITTSENLAEYENFIYCPSYADLRNSLFKLKFIEM